ncbi:MAG: hypothetical protein ABI569_03585 [Casimicrobiaceae bacterium]
MAMRAAFELSNPAALDDELLGSTTTCTDTPLVVTARRAFADFDAANDRGQVAADRPGYARAHSLFLDP